MKRIWLCISFLILVGVWTFVTPSLAADLEWESWHGGIEEVEFGITSEVEGNTIQGPWVFESGHNGAYGFGGEHYYGWGQTFAVESERTLLSVDLRVGGFGHGNTSGEFEVAVYEFDEVNSIPGPKIAYTLEDASDYTYPLSSVPVSSFDLSSFNATLKSTQTYAVAVTPGPSFSGDQLTVQSAIDIYSGGCSYELTLDADVPVHLEIIGPEEVAEKFQAQYAAIAHYGDNSTADVTDLAVWWVGPNTIPSPVASIDQNGLLITEDVNIPGEYITIYAGYTEDGVFVEGEKEVDVFAICPRGSTLEFDGEDDYVSCSTGPAITGTGPFAVSAWVKTDSVKGHAIVVQRSESSANGSYGVSIRADGRAQFYVYNGGYGFLFQSDVTVDDSLWHHVAAVRTNSTDGEIYVDGSLSGSDSGPGRSLNNVPVWIGGPGFTGPFVFDGLIDDVRIWSAALTQEEIQANMHIALDGSEPNLVAYWDFDEGEGQVVYDMSGNGNEGYLGSDPCGPDDSDPNWIDSDAPMGICTQPIANAGPDQTVSAGVGCVAEVTLDGSDSNDADGDELTYAWFIGDEEIATGVNPTIELALGEHTVELVVNDGFEDSEADEVVITVEDVMPPEFSLIVEPNVLWPPNGKMVQVRPEWEVSDNCDEEMEVSLVDVSMSAAGDINDYVEMGDDGSIYLRARKGKGGSGRVYTLTYEAVDESGNVAEASATVTVPHRRGPRRLGRGLVRRPGRQVYRRGVRRRGAKE